MDYDVVVVLGMYHSGTSALTRGLKAMGVGLGDKFHCPTEQHNPKGYWENLEIMNINTQLVGKTGLKQALSVARIPDFQWQSPAVRELQGKAAEVLRRNITPNSWWGFKDPKTIRFLPFWVRVFQMVEIKPRYVVAIRNPKSSARSYFDLHGVAEEFMYMSWFVHMIPHFRLLRNQPFVVVDYDLLMESPLLQINRINSALNISGKTYQAKDIDEYAEGFLTNNLRHKRFTLDEFKNDPRVNELTKTAYLLLYKLACDEVCFPLERFWDAWAEVEDIFNASPPIHRQLMNRIAAESVRDLNKLSGSRPIHIWGAGSGGRNTLASLQQGGFQVSAFLDSDQAKWGRELEGLPVVDSGRLEEKNLRDERPYVVIGSTYADEISACLASYGYEHRRDYLIQNIEAPVLMLS